MKIYQTEDYDLFKKIAGNRTINKAQVSRLSASLDEKPELVAAIPIIVNDKMEVIDGQHRLQALKKLNLPVNYFIVDGMELPDVQRLNSNTQNWRPLDYAKSFSELGFKDYDVYLEFREMYHLQHQVLIAYLSQKAGGGVTHRQWREGKFKTGNLGVAHKLCKELKDITRIYPRAENRSFCQAFRKISLNPLYNHDRMIEKLTRFAHKLVDQVNVEGYMREIERIYNYHSGARRVRLF